eukprot:6662027-Pyramimonas_sp.AAC.1
MSLAFKPGIPLACTISSGRLGAAGRGKHQANTSAVGEVLFYEPTDSRATKVPRGAVEKVPLPSTKTGLPNFLAYLPTARKKQSAIYDVFTHAGDR